MSTGLVATEVDRIRIETPRAAEKVGTLNLERRALPTAGRSAREKARVRFGNQTELFLERRHELGEQRVLIRTVVHRVDGVGVVVVRRGMLPGDRDEVREVVARPRFAEL